MNLQRLERYVRLREEDPKVDLKWELCLDRERPGKGKDPRIEFAIDMAAIANSRSVNDDPNGYLILGVPDVSAHTVPPRHTGCAPFGNPDEARIFLDRMQNIVVRYCDPPLDLQYREFHIEDVLIGLVTVFPPPVLPVFTRNTGREDTDGVVWVRSGHGHPRRRRATANEIREFFLGYLRTLYPFLEDEEWERYENRVRRLLRIPDADRVAYLATELVQPHVDRRATACQALGEIGGLNDNAKRLAGQLLIGALYDEEPSVHWEAVRGLSRLGDERAIVPLHALSQEASQELAIEIVDAIRAIGGATAVTTLRAILDETIDDEVQVHVQVALAELTEQELEDTLLEGV